MYHVWERNIGSSDENGRSFVTPTVCCRCNGPWETGNVSVVGDDGYTQQCLGERRPRNPFPAWRSGVLDLRLAEEDSYSTLLGYARCVPGAFYRF